MNTSISLSFSFNNNEIRVLGNPNHPFFVAKDVCDALEIINPTRALSSLDEDEKALHSMKGIRGDGMVNVVNESGLYNLIFRSRKPEAKAFRKWVTSEVLPSIRTTGGYQMHPSENVGNTPVRFVEEKIQLLETMIDLQRQIIEQNRKASQPKYPRNKVTEKEALEIIELHAQGWPHKEVARLTGRSVRTVQKYVSLEKSDD